MPVWRTVEYRTGKLHIINIILSTCYFQGGGRESNCEDLDKKCGDSRHCHDCDDAMLYCIDVPKPNGGQEKRCHPREEDAHANSVPVM